MQPGAAMSTDRDGRALSTLSLHHSQNLRGKAGDGGGERSEAELLAEPEIKGRKGNTWQN